MTPGHPLFETVRQALWDQVHEDLVRGAVFYDLHGSEPYHLDLYTATVKDGLGHEIHRRLFVLQTSQGRSNGATAAHDSPRSCRRPKGDRSFPRLTASLRPEARERALVDTCLAGFLSEVVSQRVHETETIRRHVEISLSELIHRQNLTYAGLTEQQSKLAATPPWLAASMKQCQDRLDELNSRRERRLADLDRECQCAISDIQRIGSVWVLPHPARTDPTVKAMVRDEAIERTAVAAAIEFEEAQGRKAESVENQNRGFDLISRRYHSEDPATAVEVRFIEVKGRATSGEIALTTNEYKTAARLGNEYWLYACLQLRHKPGGPRHPQPRPA